MFLYLYFCSGEEGAPIQQSREHKSTGPKSELLGGLIERSDIIVEATITIVTDVISDAKIGDTMYAFDCVVTEVIRNRASIPTNPFDENSLKKKMNLTVESK